MTEETLFSCCYTKIMCATTTLNTHKAQGGIAFASIGLLSDRTESTVRAFS